MANKDTITILKPSDEVVTTDSKGKELKPNENSNEQSGVITELENNSLVKAYGSLDAYLSIKLLDVMENAVAPDNKGELHTDYRTRLKTMELLLKTQNKTLGDGGVHVNFFSSPSQLRH